MKVSSGSADEVQEVEVFFMDAKSISCVVTVRDVTQSCDFPG